MTFCKWQNLPRFGQRRVANNRPPARPAWGRWPGGRLFTTLHALVQCRALRTFCANALHVHNAFQLNKGQTDPHLYPKPLKFDQGEGCEKNEIRAFECFGKAAAQGHQIAIYNLGLCYEYGRGVERDLKKAEECFQDAQDGTEKRISDLALEALGRLENEKLPWWQRIAPWRW